MRTLFFPLPNLPHNSFYPCLILQISDARKTYCHIKDLFSHLAEMLKMDEVSLNDPITRALKYPSYNVRRPLDRFGPDYDNLTSNDMPEMVMLYKRVKKPRANGHMFCSHVQFSAWILARQRVNGEQQTSAFVAVQKRFLYFCEKTTYSQHRSRASLFHINMTENARRFCCGRAMAGGQVLL